MFHIDCTLSWVGFLFGLQARYETITLQKTLDRMPDLVYCPKCERPTIEDARDHFAQCAECTYSFCTLCSEAFHPSVECMDPTQRLKVLAARTSGNKDMGKEEKRRYDQANPPSLSPNPPCHVDRQDRAHGRATIQYHRR